MGVKNTEGKNINPYDIVACHRLKSGGKANPHVIVRFKDRNVVRKCFVLKHTLVNIKKGI